MSNTPEALLEARPTPLSIGAFVDILRKRRWLILGILVTLPTAVGLVVSKQPKVFQAQASVVIDSTVPQYLGSSFKDVVDLETNWWSAQELLQTELRVMKSHSQSVAVASALCQKKVDDKVALRHVLPGADCEKPTDLDKAAELLRNLLTVLPVKESRVVNLVVNFNTPEMAALLANTMAQVYTQRNLERRLSQSEGAASWLGDEYGDLTTQLNVAERALIEFKKQNNVVQVGMEEQQNDLSNRRKKLSDELGGIEVKLIGVRAQRDQYALLQSDDPLNNVTPGVSDNPVVQKLKSLYVDEYAKLLELRGKYLDKHPTVIAHEARIAAIRADLQREGSLATKSVEAQYQTLIKQQRDLKSALDVITHAALQLEQRAIEYNRLKRNFDRLVKLSEQVGGRERETSLAGHLKTNNVRILDAAIVPKAAIAPNVVQALGISALIALILAIGLAFLLEMLDSTVKTQDDVEKGAGLVFLGLIPKIDETEAGKNADAPSPDPVAALAHSGSKDLYVLANPKSAVAECCRAIRTNLLFMSPDRPSRTLLVTSASPQEGKTTTAVNMAITMAQSGLKVLLVDTDMRRPRLHKAFGIPHTQDGISRAILGQTDVLAMVRDTGVANLHLLPCGALPPNPAELLHADRFKGIIQQLVGAYDRVIFDSPPVGAVTDAAILARLTDGTVLVAKSGKTSKEALSVMARRLLSDSSGVNVLGCILNDVDLAKQGSYGYYYYSRYGYYAGYDSEIEPAKPSTGG
jgi:polysaccharide biosynthesis transport protein